jgi:hypothetical protein
MAIVEPALPPPAAPWLERASEVRGEEVLAGEMRVNLIRLAALLVFYGHHLLNVLVFRDPQALAGRYHTAVTAVALAWSLTVLAIHLRLTFRRVPAWLSLAALAADTVFVTLLLCLSRDLRTTLAGLYFLVVASAGVRLSLPLVYLATLGGMAGYGAFQAYGRMFFEGGDPGPSPSAQVVYFLALGTAGVLTGQTVRQARRLARLDAPRRFCPSCSAPLPVPGGPRPGAEADPAADAERRRDNTLAGIGLLLLSALLGVALFGPGSNAKLDADAVVGLAFGLVLLAATGAVLFLRRKAAPVSLARGGPEGTALVALAFVLLLAMALVLVIAVLKTFF